MRELLHPLDYYFSLLSTGFLRIFGIEIPFLFCSFFFPSRLSTKSFPIWIFLERGIVSFRFLCPFLDPSRPFSSETSFLTTAFFSVSGRLDPVASLVVSARFFLCFVICGLAAGCFSPLYATYFLVPLFGFFPFAPSLTRIIFHKNPFP